MSGMPAGGSDGGPAAGAATCIRAGHHLPSGGNSGAEPLMLEPSPQQLRARPTITFLCSIAPRLTSRPFDFMQPLEACHVSNVCSHVPRKLKLFPRQLNVSTSCRCVQLVQPHMPGGEAVPTEVAAALVMQAANSLQEIAAHMRRGRHAALRPSDVLAPLTTTGQPIARVGYCCKSPVADDSNHRTSAFYGEYQTHWFVVCHTILLCANPLPMLGPVNYAYT